MTHKSPGKSDREGITLVQLADMFQQKTRLANGLSIKCGRMDAIARIGGSTKTQIGDGGNKMPYRCQDCREYFSVKTNTAMHNSNLPLRKWAFAIYLHLTSLKGVSSMKLHRDIGVSQKTAWYMLQRIRQAWERDDETGFIGPVEVDETYIGGKEGNKHAKNKLHLGRGSIGKAAVVGAKDRKTNKIRAKVVKATDAKTLQKFVADTAADGRDRLHRRCSSLQRHAFRSHERPPQRR